MTKNTIDITGAGSGVGEALARQFKGRDDISLRLIGGRREDLLRKVGSEIGATEVVPGDLFLEGSQANLTALTSRSDVIAHVAAINIDTIEDKDVQARLKAQQTAFAQQLAAILQGNDPSKRRLLIDVNSVTSFMARESQKAEQFPYMSMKREQADILNGTREQLRHAGIDLAVVYPGAIRTDMLSHIPEDDRAVKMANMFGKRTKNAPGHPEGIIQDRIFLPNQIGISIATLINYYLANRQELPPELQEWIIAQEADLQLPVRQEG